VAAILPAACVERAPIALRLLYINLALPSFWTGALTNKNNMSEVTTSGEPTVASPETVSAPLAAAPTFGNSRGSGLARGKRPSAPAPATAANKDAVAGSYQPTAIQVVNHQTEYVNPFAPAPVPAAIEAVANVESPVVSVPAEQPAPAIPTPVAVVAPAATPAPVETFTPAPQAVVEPKAELKILPPEEKARPAQSWEIGGESEQPAANANPRREGRPDFHPTRHADRQAQARGEDMPVRNDERPARNEQPREPRSEFRPREPRREFSGERKEPFGERKEQFNERREPRTFQPKPTPAVTEAKKSGFLGWLRGLFSGDTAEKTPAAPAQRQDERSGEGRRYEGGNRGGNRGGQYNRGGRGRGGYRGDNRGENRGPQFGSGPEGQGQNQGGPEHPGQGGERRFDDGNRGGGRRHHRGGRGRFRGDNRGGDHRSDSGPSNGPTS